jgi:hypothetical protein
VMPQARKFPELGATTDAAIEPVDQIEKAVRTLASTTLESDDPTDTPRTTS